MGYMAVPQLFRVELAQLGIRSRSQKVFQVRREEGIPRSCRHIVLFLTQIECLAELYRGQPLPTNHIRRACRRHHAGVFRG